MLANRMARELKMLATDPPPGVAAWPVGDSVTELKAQVRVSWEGGAHMRQTCRTPVGAWGIQQAAFTVGA
jgi:hypothetical protein